MVVPRDDDELCAYLLAITWMLHTGRSLGGVAPADLSEAELLDFWADPALECR